MNKTIKSSIAAVFMAAAYSAAMPAHAGLFDDEEARKAILDLRAKIDALTPQIDDKATKKSLLELSTQNEQLRQEIAKLRGQVEVLANELANAQQRQKDFYVDLDNRLRKMEPQRVTVDGKEVSIDPTEQKMYDAAFALYKSGDYRSAGASFADFLRRYPQSGLAPSAQYLLGNTYYAQRDCKNAISAQQAVVKNFPTSPKAADALLNISTCYIELKDKNSAKKALESLLSQYPDTPAAQTAKERLASFK
ncbi:MAG: tol-pal system protein YbgF [Burkholderiales bacterium]|nr:tol-pal system protein YbgF [Burkholderiales bacterium]